MAISVGLNPLPVCALLASLPRRNQGELAQPQFHDLDRAPVQQAQLPQTQVASRELALRGLERARQLAPPLAEAGRPINLAQQAQLDFLQFAHTPTDAFVVVERVGGVEANRVRQFVRAQPPGLPAAQQFAHAKEEAQGILGSLEARLVIVNHAQPLHRRRISVSRAKRLCA
ncbi:MAG TPA: hypothetical protein VEU51_06445 [Candidatus Acidoferrales bacterium]|nr:hypothetical protein [Candidatus Acidoferrales bacterium]